MKKVAPITISILAGFILVVLFLGEMPYVRAGVSGSAQNGDVNDDGDLDLSDAVYLLLHLFRGGPAPVPCADRPELVARIAELESDLAMKSTALAGCSAELSIVQTDLAKCQSALAACNGRLDGGLLPDTGQKKCYDQSSNEIPCDSTSCPGQDSFYATGCPSEGRFIDNRNGTVTDTCTGLMWQKDTADVNGDGLTINDGADALLWCDALAYCENLSFTGHDDWRLPNVRELQSIVDYGRFGPSIDPVFGALSSFYWSSSSLAGGPDVAWGVYFHNGFVGYDGEGNEGYVRAVRNAP